MRLADFILQNIEPILVNWEAFARSVDSGASMDALALRDHAADILRATARDMESVQSVEAQSDKSKGHGEEQESARLNTASQVHAVGRVGSGFNLVEVVAEYRALRASVIRLWRESGPTPDTRDLDDLTRFNESIDQSLTTAMGSYTERVDRSRQMFLAILGHDLRNPLNTVAMSAELLLRSRQLDDESSSVVSQIVKSAAAMAQMINDLLDFTGSELGAGMPLSKGNMDLKRLCQEVVEEIQAAHPNRQMHFIAKGDLRGEWDAARLRQVISNLLGNAIQHGSADSCIEVSVVADNPYVVLTVQNEGVPIPPEILATVFSPLVRGSSPESQKQRRRGSIGLGLYIAREVVIRHGGAIDVKSSVDGGTVFTVRLPR